MLTGNGCDVIRAWLMRDADANVSTVLAMRHCRLKCSSMFSLVCGAMMEERNGRSRKCIKYS